MWLSHEETGQVTRYRDVAGTSVTPETDLPEGVYSVWVRQVSESNIAMPWSSRYRFEVGTSSRPDVPVLTATSNTGGDSVEDFRGIFSWSTSSGAVSYELYIADPRGGFAEYAKDLTVTDYVSVSLSPNIYSNYRIWVRALAAC